VSLPVRTTPEADAQIRGIDEWWKGNRPAAPDLFLNELAAAFETIGHAPNIGRSYRRSPIPSTRRFLLAATRYHVYYVPQPHEVRVLAVWHARRGVGPPLRLT
jgi:plasmid stabilization system protein ParE